jgi:uncharacterized membrane protein YeaQ/YmgE (transglycosylase-associated protein family)
MVFAFAPVAGHHIITWIVIGLIAGLVAAKIVDGGGMGFFRDTVTGLAGAVIGGLILHAMRGGTHTSSNVLVEMVVALIGAVILLVVVKAMTHSGSRRGRRSFRRI